MPQLIPSHRRRKGLDGRSIPRTARRARRRHHERNEAVIRLVVTRDFHSIDRKGELPAAVIGSTLRSEEHTSELQSLAYLVCRLLLGKKKETPQLHTQAYLACRAFPSPSKFSFYSPSRKTSWYIS